MRIKLMAVQSQIIFSFRIANDYSFIVREVGLSSSVVSVGERLNKI